MKRKIPTTLATQHPDHSSKPFWLERENIQTQDESEECFLSFKELGASEYKWDWEGKYVDESVIEKLLSKYSDYFQSSHIGRDKFLTYRIPNPKVETEYRLGRAFMGIIGSANLAYKLDVFSPPLFEVILPMTETAEEILEVQKAFKEVSTITHPFIKDEHSLINHLEVVPLFEQYEVIINSASILEKYIQLHKKEFGFTPEYLRPYVARSDPALNAGIVPTVIAIKIALWRYKQLEDKTGIKLFPMIGAGSLPFRGGLTPLTTEKFASEYRGIRTTTIQSAFRYEYSISDVKKGITQLDETLPNHPPREVKKIPEILKLLKVFSQYYRSTIENIIDIINDTSKYIPSRRERLLHTGLFGYSRKVGKTKLPRAIKFTASLYSVGIPPEIIGTGRGLKYAKDNNLLNLIEDNYINLKEDLIFAGKFLNKDNLKKLSKQNKAWKEVEKDIKYIEEYLGEELEPTTEREIEHKKLTSKILNEKDDKIKHDLIVQSGILRRSLG